LIGSADMIVGPNSGAYGIAGASAWFNFPHRLADFARDEVTV
jgi:hypothetical protein